MAQEIMLLTLWGNQNNFGTFWLKKFQKVPTQQTDGPFLYYSQLALEES